MRLLSKFDEYIVELKITEALRNFPLFLSKRLRDALSKIDHEIATELLYKHADLDSRVKQTFIDMHDEKADHITFIQPNKAIQVLGWPEMGDEELPAALKKSLHGLENLPDSNDVYKRFRGETRWGRFIQGAFPGKYQQSLPGGQNKQDIESFVNLYKALYDRDDKFAMIDIVHGDDIAHFYHCDNYFSSRNGSLAESCMSHKDPSYFELYSNTSDKVGLVIMYGDQAKTKIKARALLWTLNVPVDRKFMDRVYTNDYADEQTFIDYAKSNNWLYKTRQSMGADVQTTDPSTDTSSNLTMMASLIPEDYDRYPYTDTMSFYNPYTGDICNKSRVYNAKYELTDTGGGNYEASGYNETPVLVYSKYHKEDIDKNQGAVYCKFGDDWVRSGEEIRVWNSGGGTNFAVPGYRGIVQSRFAYKKERDGEVRDATYDKWFPRSKCIWSDKLNTWIFLWSANRVWKNLERTEVDIEHKKREGEFYKKVNGEYWDNSLVRDNRLIGDVTPGVTKPVGDPPKGWHRRLEYIDSDGNIFNRGVFSGKVK